MRPHHVPFSRKWRQFQYLSKKINYLLKSGKFCLLSFSKQQKLLNRLKKLYAFLKGIIPDYRLKKTLAGAAFLIGFSFPNVVKAQTFAPVVNNPFGINVNNFTVPNFVDIDDDGDLDLFFSQYNNTGFSYELKFMENVGAVGNPNFSGQVPIDEPFGIDLQNFDSEYAALLEFADMDNDGDLDLMIGGTDTNEDGIIAYWENTGTSAQAQFTSAVVNPFGFQTSQYRVSHDLIDIDNDGDFDLLNSEYNGVIQFYENTGTPETPIFAAPVENAFGINPPTSYYSFIESADLDSDGDMDLLLTTYSYDEPLKAFYYENIGTPDEPDFAMPMTSPFGFENLGIIAAPNMVDIDADGDVDVFFGNGDVVGYDLFGEIIYFENTSPSATPDLLKNSTVKISPNPSSSFLSLQAEVISENTEINLSIIAPTGQTLERHTVRAIGNKINWETNVQFLPAGEYFIKLENGKKIGIIPFSKI